MWLYPLMAVAAFMLFAMILRFVQPELIYSFRQQLVKISIAKVMLEEEENRGENHNARLFDLQLKEFRYETLGHDAAYALNRGGKIRKLYSMMSSKRAEKVPGHKSDIEPQVSIIEIANLLHNMGEHIVATREYDYKTVRADSILAFIVEQLREPKVNAEATAGGANPGAGEPNLSAEAIRVEETVEWFKEFPISVEQTIEILLAAVHGLAYRQIAQNPPPSEVTGSMLTTPPE